MVTEARAGAIRGGLRVILLSLGRAGTQENRAVIGFIEQARRQAMAAKLPGDPWGLEELQVIDEYWSQLHRAGVIDVAGERFWVTDWGRALLERRDVSPHDRQGFMAAVRASGADPIALGYAEEAVGAWHAHLDRAAVVMVGVACERLVIMLAESVAGRDFPSHSDRLRRALREAVPIATLYGRTNDAITDAAPQFAAAVRDGLDRRLTAVFEHVRVLRNQQGHPSGAPVGHDEAHAALILFPGFYRTVASLISEIERVLPVHAP